MPQNTHNQRRRFHHVPGTDPFTHQRTRDIQPQTETDTRRFRRVLAVGTAATALLVAGSTLRDNGAEGVSVPPATTVVTAKEGDNLWSLQEAEGANGRDIRDVVADAADLNGGPSVHPDQPVILLDDPNTPAQP